MEDNKRFYHSNEIPEEEQARKRVPGKNFIYQESKSTFEDLRSTVV